MQPQICVGVPVWNAAGFVAETLQSILSQRDVRLSVFVSIDGADETSRQSCVPFLRDLRVSLVVQPDRLGWVRNSAIAMQAAIDQRAAYGCLQPADDLMSDGYLATLLSAAEARPRAAVVYSDIQSFGDKADILRQASVEGPALARQVKILLRHFNAVAWRGLTRVEALAQAGPVSSTTWRDFAVDTAWMARVATIGDLVRVPAVLYQKRYHAANTHTAWSRWSREEKVQAWTSHCAAMLFEALKVASTPSSRRLLFSAARMRLLQIGIRVGPYAGLISRLAYDDRMRMLQEFDIAIARLEGRAEGIWR